MSDDGSVEIYAALGFGFGLFSFFRGFKIYREYRVLADTPEMPIRSIPMGLVQVHGKALGDQMVTSPVSQTSCYFYKVDIEKYQVDSKGNGSWKNVGTDLTGVPFYLDDATGKVLVDPNKAEYDLLQTCKRKTGSGIGLGLGSIPAIGKNPGLTLGPGADDATLFQYAQAFSGGGGLGSITTALSSISFSRGVNRGWSTGSRGQYRFTEYCILKDHWYDITGTCVENPRARDEHDRNLIRKGENEPTFLISWQSEKNIERTLRNRAMWHVLGGGALSVICLGVLLLSFGWL